MDQFIEFPSIDPIIFCIYEPFCLRWYSLAYIVGLLLAWVYGRYLIKKYPTLGITAKNLEDIINHSIIGILVGGRLGYILFYKPFYYLSNPTQVLKIWEGGMSFHGGLIGVICVCWSYARSRKVSFLKILDLLSAAAPIGLGLGRLANFINDELWGRITTVAWAVKFPSGGYYPRHPSQIYEAFFEGFILFIIIRIAIYKGLFKNPGSVSALFSLGYGLSRFGIEFFREPDGIWHFQNMILTSGQLLSLPMILGGIILLRWNKKAPTQLI